MSHWEETTTEAKGDIGASLPPPRDVSGDHLEGGRGSVDTTLGSKEKINATCVDALLDFLYDHVGTHGPPSFLTGSVDPQFSWHK